MNHFYKDTRRLDLWYPWESLKQEMGMRTAYLGKLRSSEQAVHLLDLIHLTDDEEELMMSYAQNAMAEVYECFDKYARHLHVPTMVFNDGKLNTIKTQAIPSITIANPNNTATDNQETISISCETDIVGPFDESKYGVKLNVTLTYETAYTIIETGTNVPHEKIEVPLSIIATKDTTSGRYVCTTYYTATLSPATDMLSASFINSYSVKLNGAELYILSPKTISEFSWVEYDGELGFSLMENTEDTFISIIQGKQKNMGEFILYPVDPRYSIRYYIEYAKELSVHYIHPLDIAIKEALVCYIIAHWLEYAYPDEAANWHAKYDKALSDVRKRCNVQEKPIKKLIPRWF